ncbi:MAG: S1 RNA-binding domain-containing protein, partial [Anaerolineae bacterium]|nr:S1 RNA-binding domain-containing protein [Anaerolineae bacterium]
PKAYEQAAGFIRILDGTNALDQSAIHPESYRTAKSLMKLAGIQITNPAAARKQGIEKLLKQTPVDVLAKDLGVGVSTMQDILDQIILPGRDPRQDAAKPILRSDILSMEDLLPGIILKGTVRNVVDFGAFIDIGVKQDGLLHRSKTPQDRRLQVGDILEVEIQNIDAERGRIALGWVEET